MKNRRLRNILLAAAALPVAAAAVFLGGGIVIARRMTVKLPAAAELAPETVGRPGDAALATAELRLPWGNFVTAATAETDDDAVAGPPETSSGWRWGYRIWRIAVKLRPLGTTDTAPGKLVLTLDKPLPGAGSERCEIAIPALHVAKAAAATADKPRLADPEKTGRTAAKWWRYLIAAAIPLAAAAWYLIRRATRRRRPAPTPWELAFAALAELDAEMKKRGFRAETGVAKLSDILREYLAARFGVPAVTETGSGFLAAAAVAELDREDREFLRGFFAAAELVKFARVPADPAELERAVAAAKGVIGRTVPPPPGKAGAKTETEAAP